MEEEEEKPKMRTIAFQASLKKENGEEDDEEMALLTQKNGSRQKN